MNQNDIRFMQPSQPQKANRFHIRFTAIHTDRQKTLVFDVKYENWIPFMESVLALYLGELAMIKIIYHPVRVCGQCFG